MATLTHQKNAHGGAASGFALLDYLLALGLIAAMLYGTVSLAAFKALEVRSGARQAAHVRNVVYATAHFRYCEGAWPAGQSTLEALGYLPPGVPMLSSDTYVITGFSCTITMDRISKKQINAFVRGIPRADNPADMTTPAKFLLSLPVRTVDE